MQKSFNMNSSKKKMTIHSLLVNPIIYLETLLKKVLKNGELIAIKCHNTPGNNDSGSYEINFLYYRGGSPEEWLVWKDKLLKALDGQNFSTEPQRYLFTARLLTQKLPVTMLHWILVYVTLITSAKYFW